MMDNQPLTLDGLTPRESALDAYYRMTWALDTNNWELFASGFTSEQTPESHLGESDRHYVGLDEIRAGLYDAVSTLDTHHVASNARVALNQATKTGKMWIMCLNQHYRAGTQKDHTAPRLYGGNRYLFDMVLDSDGQWRIKNWTVEFGWREGDIAIVEEAGEYGARCLAQVNEKKKTDS